MLHAVQVAGTENVIAACISCGVPRLVYTSTVNTVFGGRQVAGDDQCLLAGR